MLVFGSALFARLRLRPWWLWCVWFGVALVAFIVFVALTPTWRQALLMVGVGSVLGLLGPEVGRLLRWLLPNVARILWRTVFSITRGLWRRLRRWVSQRPIRALYLLGGLALVVACINPQLGGSALALVLVIIGLRVLLIGVWPIKKKKKSKK